MPPGVKVLNYLPLNDQHAQTVFRTDDVMLGTEKRKMPLKYKTEKMKDKQQS
jgi:hypothetical protein